MRKKIKNIKKEDYSKKISLLEKEREESKKTANHYLHLCSQLAEEVIVLRNQLDKYLIIFALTAFFRESSISSCFLAKQER